ncbi:NADH-quinone oxidoreductase subunit C [Candidatus Margulisiibacteriota bacterium]
MHIVEQIKQQFKGKADIHEKSVTRLYVTVAKEDAHEVVRYMFKDMGARMAIASGVDTRPGIEILYHMAFDAYDMMVTVKVLVKKPELSMPTFTDFMPAADWIEREIHELLGVNFVGHPRLEKLLLPDDWPEGVHPLRKKTLESERENVERDYK